MIFHWVKWGAGGMLSLSGADFALSLSVLAFEGVGSEQSCQK